MKAVCWGWIDRQTRPFDETSWLQRYTQRRSRSGWSRRNRDIVARLEDQGRIGSQHERLERQSDLGQADQVDVLQVQLMLRGQRREFDLGHLA